MTGNKLLFVALLGFSLFAEPCSPSYVTVNSNYYQHVVVRIEPDLDVSDCQSGLDGIKATIQSLSTSWSNALSPSLHFGNVTIVAPESWRTNPICLALITTGNQSEITWIRTQRADFVVTPEHPVFGWRPISFQYGGCGQQGLPITVPSSFQNSSSGSLGKILAREWAHYRYGVFDEGGQPGDERHPSASSEFQTDRDDKRTVANTCAEKKPIRGKWNSETCETSLKPECEFVPEIQNPDVHASLMYQPELSHMDKFCNESNHDPTVPSKLNYYCNGKSASSVILQHSDYKSVTGSGSPPINFNVVFNPFAGYHIILDTGSFDSSNFIFAKRSLIQFVSHLPFNTQISIDSFNDTCYTVLEPTVINKDNQRDILLLLVDIQLEPQNYNGLAKALENGLSRALKGLDVLLVTKLPAKLSASNLNLNDFINRYKSNMVNLHLLYFNNAPNKDQVQLASLAPYGSYNLVPAIAPSSNDGMSSFTWSVGALQSLYSRSLAHRIKISEATLQRTSGSDVNKTGSFLLDSPASRLLLSLYHISDTKSGVVVDQFRVYRPSGMEVEIKSDMRNEIEGMFMGRISAQDLSSDYLESGYWRYEITMKDGTAIGPLRLDVWCEPDKGNGSFIEMETWNSAIDQNPWDATVKPMGLYAKLTQNRKPVRGVNVTAHVYAVAQNSANAVAVKVATIPLLDQGFADVTSGDGIYSGWMTSISNASLSYAIKVEASSTNSQAQVDSGTFDQQPTTGSSIDMSAPVSAIERFHRIHYGPSFQMIAAAASDFDYIPPERIVDLTIIAYSSSKSELVLQWTPPKDNHGSGSTVTRFGLVRKQSNAGDFTETFNKDKPDESGRLTHVVTNVPRDVEPGGYVTYSIYGIDASNTKASASNIVVLMGPVPFNGLSALAWGLIGGAIFIAVIIIIALLIYFCCPDKATDRKRKAAKAVREIFKHDEKKTKTSSKTIDKQHQWRTAQITNQSVNNGSIHEEPIENVSLRTTPATGRDSERIYFSQRDIDEMTSGPRSDAGSSFDGEHSTRGTEEIMKRAPSITLQLATILEKNNSTLSMDRVGVSESPNGKKPLPKPEVIIQPKIYSRPTSQRPASQQPYGSIAGQLENGNQLSQSETNLYQNAAVIQVRPNSARTSRGSRGSSYISVFDEPRSGVYRAEPQQQAAVYRSRSDLLLSENDPGSNYANVELSQYEGQPIRLSSFDPMNHPANQIGIPLEPPPPVPRAFTRENGSVSSGASGQSSASKAPKLVSSV